MTHEDIGRGSHFALAGAAIVGLICSAVAGLAGLVAAVWIATVLVGSGRPAGARVGVTTLGLGALYALAAASGFAGGDPEDVDRHLSLRLGVVAVGCAIVGITSALVWLTSTAHRR